MCNLTQLFVALIHGPGAVVLMAEGQPFIGTWAETMFKLWGLTHTTPGAIATCAMLVRRSDTIKHFTASVVANIS